MFGRGGSCYIVMPKHVAGPFPRVTISTAAPVETSTATVIAPFWQGIDLALGVARGALLDRCTGNLGDLTETSAVLNATAGDLLRLTPNGEETRNRVRIGDRNYLTFTGTLETSGTDIAQGTSGAFAFADGRPLGMAISSDGPTRAAFMRSGEILIHVRRFLEEQGGAYAPSAEVAAKTESTVPGALPLQYVRSSAPPLNPRFAPENMVGTGQFVFSPQRRMSFVFGFDDITAVSRVMIRSTASASQTTPKNIIVRWSLDPEGRRFGSWHRGEMGPDGVFDSGQMAARNLRYVEIIVLNTWSAGEVVIDAVTAY